LLSRERIDAALSAAFMAPALPIAKVGTGIPAGICTIDKRESNPFNLTATGTPITGLIVNDARTPGK